MVDQNLPPEDLPKADFYGYAQREGGKGFGIRAYWDFDATNKPRIVFRVEIQDMVYRFSLRPAHQDSGPGKTIVERYLMREAAKRAAEVGRPPEIPEEEPNG